MPDAATVYVSDVSSLEGVSKAGKPWRMWKLTDGNGDEYVTFDGKLGGTLAVLEGKKADITSTEDAKGKKLHSAFEHVEAKTQQAGGYNDPVRQRHIAIQNAMYHAVALVNADAERGEPELALTVSERVKRVKIVASDLAWWGQEWSERAERDVPFEDDGIPFGEDDERS